MTPENDLTQRFVSLNIRQVDRLRNEPTGSWIPELPFGFRQKGAVAVIDMSGFTKLTTMLAQFFGSGGGAKISNIINPVFSMVIDCVHRHNGSVVKFAGDALICCWAAVDISPDALITPEGVSDSSRPNTTDSETSTLTPDPYTTATLSAILCCLEVLQKFRSYTINVPASEDATTQGHRPSTTSLLSAFSSTDQDAQYRPPSFRHERRERYVPFALKIHISVGCGDFGAFHVGRAGDRAEYFVAGPAAEDAMYILQYTRSGEVGMSYACWEVLTQALTRAEADVKLAESFPEAGGRGCCIIKDDAPDLEFTYKLLSESNKTDRPAPMGEADPTNGWTTSRDYIEESLSKILGGIIDDGVYDVDTLHNELRNVCVVFVRLPSLGRTDDPVNMLLTAQKIMTIVLDAVRRYEGTIRQLNVDDKGATALLVWGVEGYTHERGDAVFALHAAMEVRDRLRELVGKEFAIGASEGIVFSGVMGNAARSDGTVLGVAVNEAARLMTEPLSHGRILCTESLYTEAMESIEFDPSMRVIMVKGSDAPLSIYIPLRPVQTHNSESFHVSSFTRSKSLIGREKEKIVVHAAVERWRHDLPVKLVISGATGLGKTAISAYLKEAALEIPDAIICENRSSETHKLTPFHCLRTILTSLFDRIHAQYVETGILEYRIQQAEIDAGETLSIPMARSSTGSVDHFRSLACGTKASSRTSLRFTGQRTALGRKVVSLLSAIGEGGRSVEVLNDLMGFMQTPAEARPLLGASFSSQIASVVGRLLNKLTLHLRIKVMILTEDAQWHDVAGFAILTDLVRRCPNVFFYTTSRPIQEYVNDSVSATFTKLISSEHTTHLELTPMDRQDTIQLAQSILKSNDIDPRLLDQIWKRSQGNPMVVELLCDSLRMTGQATNGTLAAPTALGATRSAGRRRASISAGANTASGNLPMTERKREGMSMPVDIRSAIIAQLDRVPGPLKQILRVASVAGQYFSLIELAAVLNETQRRSSDRHSPWSDILTLRSYIQKKDTMKMLLPSADLPGGGSTSLSFSDVEGIHNMGFRHIVLKQVIYNSILPDRREALHEAFANYYEKQLSQNPQNRQNALPMLVFHLDHVPGDGARKIKYAEMVFVFYAEESRHEELGLAAYERLKRLMEDYPEDVPFDSVQLAKHHRRLAQLYDQNWDPAAGLQECQTALSLLGIRLPKYGSLCHRFNFVRRILTQHRLLNATDEKKRTRIALAAFKREVGEKLYKTVHEPDQAGSLSLTTNAPETKLTRHISEVLDILRVMLNQLNLLRTPQQNAYICLTGMVLSHAIAEAEPAHSAYYSMAIAFGLLQRNYISLSSQYVSLGAQFLDRCPNTYNTLFARQTHVRYLYAVGNWILCEKIGREVHALYDGQNMLGTPMAYLNATIRSGCLHALGKREEYTDLLIQAHDTVAELDSTFHWGRHVACDVAAAMAQAGETEEALRWYNMAQSEIMELPGEHGHVSYYRYVDLMFLLRVEVIFLQQAKGEEMDAWIEGALETCEKLIPYVAKLPYDTPSMHIIHLNVFFIISAWAFNCKECGGSSLLRPTLNRELSAITALARPLIRQGKNNKTCTINDFTALCAEGLFVLLHGRDVAKCRQIWKKSIETHRHGTALTPYYAAMLIARITRLEKIFSATGCGTREGAEPLITRSTDRLSSTVPPNPSNRGRVAPFPVHAAAFTSPQEPISPHATLDAQWAERVLILCECQWEVTMLRKTLGKHNLNLFATGFDAKPSRMSMEWRVGELL